VPEKVTITTEAGDSIEAMFNPERYTVTKGVQFAEIGIPGRDSPVLQFVRGQNEKITMELFFDTTDKGMVDNVTDVRDESGKVYKLLKIDPDTHAPPRVTVTWGDDTQLFSYGSSVSPWCVIENLNEEFSLFAPSGIPLRSKLTVTLREAWTIEQQLQATGRHSSDRTSVRRVQRGQTLAYIAFLEYNDSTNWRPIADANRLDNPKLLKPGMMLTIPSNPAEKR
jgi:nucleoid-associated protein YgaU